MTLGPVYLARGQQRTEIQIVSKDTPMTTGRKVEDIGVRCIRLTNGLLRTHAPTGTRPTAGSSSCRSGISCGRKWQLDFLDAPSQRLANVFHFKVGISG